MGIKRGENNKEEVGGDLSYIEKTESSDFTDKPDNEVQSSVLHDSNIEHERTSGQAWPNWTERIMVLIMFDRMECEVNIS